MTDFKIMEAVNAKVLEEDSEAQKKAQKEAEKKHWKEDKKDLMQYAE